MGSKSLARPIDNVLNLHESRVMAVIDHLAPVLESWRQGEDLRQEKDELNARCDDCESQILSLKPAIAQLKTQIEDASKKAGQWRMLAIGLVLTGLILAYFMTGLIALALSAGFPFWKWRQANTQVQSIGQTLQTQEQQLSEADAVLRQSLTRIEVIDQEMDDRMGGFPEITLADVHLSVQKMTLAGHQVLNDRSGAHAAVPLKTIDLTGLTDEVSDITGKLQEVLKIPPLLSADESTDAADPLNSLYGEENRLQDLVGEFTNNLAKLRDVNLSLHLVPATGVLHQRLSTGEVHDAQTDKATLISGSGSEAAETQKFVDTMNVLTSTSGQQMLGALSTVYQNLEQTCQRYASARITSVNQVHSNLTQVLERASWVSRKVFCPRTIVAPSYIQDLIGVQLETAHQLDIHTLLDRLQSDEVVRARITKKPDLLEELSAAHQSVSLYADMQATDENGQVLQNISIKPRHVQTQMDDALKLFRLTLNKILTGAANPIVNFSNEAQLHYDPDLDEWTSDLAAYVYRTPDAIKYGSVVKAHCDLMIPLWEHLWTEKADFRKSELFRTNEMMISMSEKEAEKLIQIANQFRDDLRTNRENLYLIESDLNSKFDEILSFRDGMSLLGLLSTRVMEQISDDRLQRLLIGDSPLASADKYETTLSALPKAQTMTRGTVHDPIEMVRDASVLLSAPRTGGPRLIAP